MFTQPGATSAGIGPTAGRPILRGLADARVRIQENGVGTTDVTDIAQDHAVPIDPLAVQKTEVIRGPGALRLGSQAVGGVVEATNNRIPTAAPPGGVSAETRVGGTSGNDGWESGLLLDAGGRDVAIHADVYGRQATDYRIPRYPYLQPPDPAPRVKGRQPNTSVTAQGAAIGGSYLFESGYAGLAVSRYASDFYVPGIASAADHSHNSTQQTKIAGKGEIRPDIPYLATIRYWFGHSEYRHDETERNERGSPQIGATFRNDSNEGRIEFESVPIATPLGILTAIVGGQGVSSKLNTRGGAILQPALTTTGAGYIFAETRHTPTFRTQLAGRIEDVALRGTSYDAPANFLPPPDDPRQSTVRKGYTPKSVSVSALQDLPSFLVASLTAQRIERAPRALELFAFGPDDSEKTFKIGNRNLDIETASTIEGGISRVGGDVRFDARGYYTRYHNFVTLTDTGYLCQDTFASCGTGTDYIQAAYSQRDAIFRGAEIAGQWAILPVAGGTFGLDGQFDFVRATFTDGSNVPRIPPMRIGGGAFWRDKEWSVRLGLLHAYPQNDYAQFDTRTPGYDILKFELERRALWRGSPWGPVEVTTGLVGDNLLDASIRNSVQFHKDEVLLPGRSFKAFLNVKYASFDALQATRKGWFLLQDGDEDDQVADPAERWRGVYAGLNLGFSRSKSNTFTDPFDVATDASLPGATRGRTFRNTVIGGGQGGYNWVNGRVLSGIEADLQSSGGETRVSGSCASTCLGTVAAPAASVRTNLAGGLSGSLRGRVGALLAPDLLAYVTAGVPVAGVTKAGQVSLSDANGAPVTTSFANTPIKVGWSVGAGLEAAMGGPWTARLEYLHKNFGTTAQARDPLTPATQSFSFNSKLSEDVVRAGVNYRFDVANLFEVGRR